MTTAPSVLGRADGADRPTDLVAAARELQPLVRENSAANEAAGQLTDVVVDALHDKGLFGMWVPAPLGGVELDPVSSLEVVQTLTEADPSTGWVVMAASLATGTGGAYLGESAVAGVFYGPRFPLGGGRGTPPGRGGRAGGGEPPSGGWGFAAGGKKAPRS